MPKQITNINLYGLKFKVYPEAKEDEVILVNEESIKDQYKQGYDLPEAFKRTKNYHVKIKIGA